MWDIGTREQQCHSSAIACDQCTMGSIIVRSTIRAPFPASKIINVQVKIIRKIAHSLYGHWRILDSWKRVTTFHLSIFKNYEIYSGARSTGSGARSTGSGARSTGSGGSWCPRETFRSSCIVTESVMKRR